MTFIKEKNIGKISFITSVILVVLLTTILGGVFIHEKYSHFNENLERIENIYITLQKERLKSEISIEIDRINAQQKTADNEFRQGLKDQVNQCHQLVANLFQKFSLQDGETAVKQSIKNTLRPIWLNNDNGRFFIWSATTGDIILQPDTPLLEGTNIFKKLSKINPTFQDQLKKINKWTKEGYLSYKYPDIRNNKLQNFPIQAYIKFFEPYDWIIGTSEYVNDFETQLQNRIIRDLNFKAEDTGAQEYVFVYKLHDMIGGDKFATMLVNVNRPDLVNTHLSDSFKDAKGNMFRKQMLKGIRENGDAFVTYWYRKPEQEGTFAKLSYFKYYPRWNWIVAKGAYLDDLDLRVNQMQKELRGDITHTVRFLAFALIITCIVFMVLAFFFSRGVSILFEGYKKIQKKHQKKLEHLNTILEVQATTDPLTKIYNRAYFNNRIEQEMDRAKRYKNRLSLILFDIDHFKDINDTYGHLAGDDVLKDISDLCLKNIRSSDILARWGGEEFVVLVPENEGDTASFLAEKLRIIIEEYKFSINSQITCSFGISHYDEKENKDQFIGRADTALYQSKETGRNKITSL